MKLRLSGKCRKTAGCNDCSIPVGIGIDMVTISELRKLIEQSDGVFLKHTFSENEIKEAERTRNRFSYLAGRFAVKEAVFKAIAHLTPEHAFDFRIVETLKQPDGSPRLQKNEKLAIICDNAGVSNILVSISNEGDFAIAVAQAVCNSGATKSNWRREG